MASTDASRPAANDGALPTGSVRGQGDAQGSDDDLTTQLGRVDLVRSGEESGWTIVLIGAWNAQFVYAPLIDLLPDAAAIVVVSVMPDSWNPTTAVIDNIPGRAKFVGAVLGDMDVVTRIRPIVVLGHSRGGLLAHQVSSDLASGGYEIRLEVLVDTVFPGEEVRRPEIIAAARREKYRMLLGSGQYGTALGEVRTKATARLRQRALRTGTALLRYAGTAPESIPATNGVQPLTEVDYSPGGVDHAVLLYRASRSDRSRTTARWKEVVPNLVEVVVEGQHGGEEGVLSRERVREIAADLVQRLEALDSP